MPSTAILEKLYVWKGFLAFASLILLFMLEGERDYICVCRGFPCVSVVCM